MVSRHNRGVRLAVFDVEGVILPKRRLLLLLAVKKLSFVKIIYIMFMGFLYEIGFFPLEKTLKSIYQLFQGVTQKEIFQILTSIPMIPDVSEIIEQLKEAGLQIALISSGIPDFLVQKLAIQLGADYARGLKTEIIDSKLTGKIEGDIIKTNGKAIILEKILKTANTPIRDCIAIVDDRNNISMFKLCSRTIGYNPDPMVAAKCDFAVRGKLRDIIAFLDIPIKIAHIRNPQEFYYRDIIHIGSFTIPLLCQFSDLNRNTISMIIMAITVAYAFSELARKARINFPLFTTITNLAAKGEEKWVFATSPIFFALGIMFSLTILPSTIGFSAIAILTIGDGTARIVGSKFGKRILPYNKAKKVEGTIIGVLLSFLASLLFVTPVKAFTASIICMTLESFPLPIDDNIVIPVVAGLILTTI